MRTEGILLAAGRSVRMGIDKLSLAYRGKTIFEHSLSALTGCKDLSKVIVVVAPDYPFQIENNPFCKVVINEYRDEGLGTSFRKGIEAASENTDSFLIAFADMPRVTSSLCSQLIKAFGGSGKKILVPRYNGQNGHPVIFSGGFRKELTSIKGDSGGINIIKENLLSVEYFETTDNSIIFDIDTKEDYFETNRH